MKKHQSTNQMPLIEKVRVFHFVPPDFPALKRKHHRNQSLSKSSEINPKTSSGLPVPSTSVSTSWGSRSVWMQVDHFWYLKKVLNCLGWPNVSVSFRFFLANWNFLAGKTQMFNYQSGFCVKVSHCWFLRVSTRSSCFPVPTLKKGVMPSIWEWYTFRRSRICSSWRKIADGWLCFGQYMSHFIEPNLGHDIACVILTQKKEDPYLPSHFPLLLWNAPKISL